MPLSPNPRGSSIPTPQLDAQTAVPPDTQIQIPAPQPTHQPGCTNVAAPASPTPATSHPNSAHPTSQTLLSESAARELAKLKSQLHALASPDGFAPTRDEFTRAIRRASRPYCKFFKGYEEFIRACGLKSANDRRRELTADLRDAKWAAQSAAAHGASISSVPFVPSVPSVLSDSPAQPHAQPIVPARPVKPKPPTNEPFYGDPIHCCDMAHAPVNEQGVVLLFGMLAKKLNFRIEMVRTGYPDCEAKHKGPDKKWRRLRIEFEFLSSRFNHDPAGCDLIVCWEDDANPTHLPVLELKNHVGREPITEFAPAETSAKEPAPAQTSSAPEEQRLVATCEATRPEASRNPWTVAQPIDSSPSLPRRGNGM